MQNYKHFSSSPVNLGVDLLALQNGGLDKSKDNCDQDLKLVCSDGYLMSHKALLPNYQSPTSSNSSEQLETLSLPNLNIIQASKLLFLIYTGEVLISKNDQKVIKPALEALEIFHVKRAPLSRGPTPTRTVNTRRRSSSAGTVTSGSSKDELTRRKIAGVKNLPYGSGEENVFIFGDGTIMGIPMSTTPASPTSLNLVYNLNGDIILNDSSDKGFHCAPCSLIFCDSSDFLNHSSSSSCLNHSPPPPLTPTIKVIKLEPGFIKVEEHCHVDTLYFEDDPTPSPSPDPADLQVSSGGGEGGAPLNLCLICVRPCKDPVDLMVHSKQKHLLSSEKDYDYGSWTCKWCHITCGSTLLPVFLQHAYHCKKENRIGRKRSASISPPRNKRRKTQQPPLITSKDNLPPSSPSSQPSLPPTPRTPQHLKDKLTEEMKPPIPPISTDNLSDNCPTQLIIRPPNPPRRPKSLHIPNSNNRKLKLVEVKEAAPLSNPAIMYKGVNVTLSSGTGVPTPNANKIATVNQPGTKRKAIEEAVSSSSTKKLKKTSDPKKISPWTCRRCPTKTFATQNEYMHHDCRQCNLKVN